MGNTPRRKGWPEKVGSAGGKEGKVDGGEMHKQKGYDDFPLALPSPSFGFSFLRAGAQTCCFGLCIPSPSFFFGFLFFCPLFFLGQARSADHTPYSSSFSSFFLLSSSSNFAFRFGSVGTTSQTGSRTREGGKVVRLSAKVGRA